MLDRVTISSSCEKPNKQKQINKKKYKNSYACGTQFSQSKAVREVTGRNSSHIIFRTLDYTVLRLVHTYDAGTSISHVWTRAQAQGQEKGTRPFFLRLRLCLRRPGSHVVAYACACAYACVVRVNQALSFWTNEVPESLGRPRQEQQLRRSKPSPVADPIAVEIFTNIWATLQSAFEPDPSFSSDHSQSTHLVIDFQEVGVVRCAQRVHDRVFVHEQLCKKSRVKGHGSTSTKAVLYCTNAVQRYGILI